MTNYLESTTIFLIVYQLVHASLNINVMGIFFDWTYSISAWHKNPISVVAHGYLSSRLVSSFNDWYNYHTPINNRMCVEDQPLQLHVFEILLSTLVA